MNKNNEKDIFLIKTDQDLIKIIYSAINKLSAVCKTLGPHGSFAIIENQSGNPKVTKDGVTIAKSIDSNDSFESMIINMAKDVCFKTNTKVGDGTTTSIRLLTSIVESGLKLKEAGYNVRDIVSGINIVYEKVIQYIDENAFVPSDEDLRNVAYVAANDRELGNLIYEAFSKVNKKYGLITVEASKSTDTYLEIIDGITLDAGFLSPYFVNNTGVTNTSKVEFEDAYIFAYNGKINEKHEQELLFAFLDHAAISGKPSVVFCDDMDKNILHQLLINMYKGNIKIVAVKLPAHGNLRNELMKDVSALTQASIIDATHAKDIKYNNSYAGVCKKIIVKENSTVIIGGAGDKAAVDHRCQEIEEQLKDENIEEYEKERLQSRLSSLRGGVGVIKVGGATSPESEEKCDRVTDGVCTFKCAVAGKICIGGGITLNNIGKKLLQEIKYEDFANESEFEGAKLMAKSLFGPIHQIIKNSGDNPDVIINEISKLSTKHGYYAPTREIKDMTVCGIYDAQDVVVSSVKTSVSISKILFNLDISVINKNTNIS